MKLSLMCAIMGLVGCTAPSSEVTFDPDTGKGAIEKDVKSVLYQSNETYEAVCECATGQQTYDITHNLTRSVKVSGLSLIGYGRMGETGTIPEVGGTCSTNGVWVRVVLTSSNPGSLLVNYW